jgi:hypothetical protein
MVGKLHSQKKSLKKDGAAKKTPQDFFSNISSDSFTGIFFLIITGFMAVHSPA